MLVATWNVNGLRAALRKGFSAHLERLGVDVLLLQEVRATPDQLGPSPVPDGWHASWNPSSKPGYAGVSVWSRWPIEPLPYDGDADPDGRVLWMSVAGWRIGSIYLPSGSAGPERQSAKEHWMGGFRSWMDRIVASDIPTLIGGDLNIAHTPLDIHNPQRSGDLSGFLPHERAWFGAMLGAGWTDAVRQVVGPRVGPWSWWSNRGRARAEDRGWRIDYQLANPAAASRLLEARIDREAGIQCSDHAPVLARYQR